MLSKGTGTRQSTYEKKGERSKRYRLERKTRKTENKKKAEKRKGRERLRQIKRGMKVEARSKWPREEAPIKKMREGT